MEKYRLFIRCSQTKLSLVAVAAAILAAAGTGWTAKSDVPVSAFRKYFWGARQAYEERDFKKAERLLRTYQDLGSPSDKLLKAAGCDPKWEVSLFSKALKETRACLKARSKSPSWGDAEHAKFAVIMALRNGDASTLMPYVDCAPVDLVAQSTTCGAHSYRTAFDLSRLTTALKSNPDIIQWPSWREFPARPHDEQNVRWELHTLSYRWKPCGMQGAALVSLREDPPGEFRIAGFAASCFDTP